VQADGWYYYTHTTARNLTLWKTRDITSLRTAERKVVWAPPAGTTYSKNIWAPELHRLDGKWYLYFAADDGRNRNHRIYVLENASRDPLAGEWTFKGQVRTPEDKWAIDASVLSVHGAHYMLWSGWPGDENGEQNIYLARMKNPWTTEGERIAISTPAYAWEKVGNIARPGPDDKPHVSVNEGPEALIHGDKVMVIYSASGCWTDAYALGMVWARADADLMDPDSWHKVADPVFRALDSGAQGTYAAGHNSFFKSPDGREDWILYHANPGPNMGCGAKRSPRAQKFAWSAEGFPVFGKPADAGEKLAVPSGSVADLTQDDRAPGAGRRGNVRRTPSPGLPRQ
jgi:GH43 family beta-xylosidase